MHLPPVETISSEIYVNGDVIIHESAVIASGAILQAAPGSYIVIGARVCIGMGVIINASQGAIEIESGAVLGNGVLVIGRGKIGKDCCIGALTTIFNSSVEPMTIIAAGSIIGDLSRPVTTILSPDTERETTVKEQTNSKDDNESQSHTEPVSERSPPDLTPKSTESVKEESAKTPTREPEVEVTTKHEPSEPDSEAKSSPVVGQVYINQLLLTLFPEREFLNSQKNPPKNQEDNSNKLG